MNLFHMARDATYRLFCMHPDKALVFFTEGSVTKTLCLKCGHKSRGWHD